MYWEMAPNVFVKNDKVVDPEIIMVSDIYPRTKSGIRTALDRRHVSDNDIYWGRGIWWRNGEMSATFRVEDCLDVIVNELSILLDSLVNQLD